jgi:uncharacterized protein (TIGR00369 family)
MTMATREELIRFLDEGTPRTVLGALGARIEKYDADETVVACDIDERHLQHAGVVHGGVYVVLAESAASTAAAFSVDIEKYRVAGQEISASHVRPATSGTLRATTRPLAKGKTALVYAIDVTCDGKLVSTCRCTVAVRPHT